ncbi:MAG: GerMN domain-containing protein [Clostridia bacterium]|jgi:hypothetical protein
MKKIIPIIFSIFIISSLAGCSLFGNNPVSTNKQASNSPAITVVAKDTIAEYFPYTENKEYIFKGEGNEFASYNVFVDYINGPRAQIRLNDGGTEVVQVIENKNGELRLLYKKSECYFRENFLAKTYKNSEILLKEPIEKGTAWTLSNKTKRSITNINVDVKTSLGIYKAVEVTTFAKDGKTKDYYVKNMGLVKTVFIVEDGTITSTLDDIKSDRQFTQMINFYYPNINDGKLYYKVDTLKFNTNDTTKIVFENAFKTAPKSYVGKLIGSNTKINSLYLNKDNMVYVDFSKDLVIGMNAGSEYESMILKCITNTLGIYYGVDKVYITIDGEPYSSGHIAMSKGQFFTVNTNKNVEIK